MAKRTAISIVLIGLFASASALAQPPHVAPPPAPAKAPSVAPVAAAPKVAPPLTVPKPASAATPELRTIVLTRTELRRDLSTQQKLSRAIGVGVEREREVANQKSEASAKDLGLKYAAAAKNAPGERGELATQLRNKIAERDAQKEYLVKDQAAAVAAADKYNATLSAATKRLGGDRNAYVTAQQLPEVQSAQRDMNQANNDKATRFAIVKHLDNEIPSLATKLGFLVGRPKE